MRDMNLTDSIKLLRNYAEEGDETVGRYVDSVYSTAVRRVAGDVNLAQDVTQREFAALPADSRTGSRANECTLRIAR